jgi:uncharacterized protein (DUF305 family)
VVLSARSVEQTVRHAAERIDLCKQIVESQRQEIAKMQALLARGE